MFYFKFEYINRKTWHLFVHKKILIITFLITSISDFCVCIYIRFCICVYNAWMPHSLYLAAGQQYCGFHEQYKTYDLSLTELYAQSNLTTTIASIHNLNYQMVSRFQERIISVQRIQGHISSLYYWLSAQVGARHYTQRSNFPR